MGSMSASDAAPLPRLGEVFFDVRGSSRSMRLSWYSDTGVAVFSIWQGGTCTGTFRLPIDDLPRMVEALQRGPRGAALPAADGPLSADRPRRGIAGVPGRSRGDLGGRFPRVRDGPAHRARDRRIPVVRPRRPGRGLAGLRRRRPPERRASACRAPIPVAGPRPATASRPTGMTRSVPGPTRPTRKIRARRSRGSPTTGRPRRPPTRPRRPTATTRWAAATGTTRPARRTRRRPASWAPAATEVTRPGRGIRWTGPARSTRERLPRGIAARLPRQRLRRRPARIAGPTRPTRTSRARRSPGSPTTGRPAAARLPAPPSYRDDPLGGGYRDHPSGPQHPLDGPSPLGPGSDLPRGIAARLPRQRLRRRPARIRVLPGPTRTRRPRRMSQGRTRRTAAASGTPMTRSSRSTRTAHPRAVGYPDDTRGGSHPYDLPPERPEQRAPRGRS